MEKEIEYRLGLYFGLKSGALHVHDDKYGNKEQVMRQLEEDITKDVISLSLKKLGELPDGRDFRSVCVWYKNKLM